MDSVSVGSQNYRLPPPSASKSASNRLGQFLRKIGASKPPGNAASLVSLNKVASEMLPSGPAPLMKSNSLSHDPWKKHIVQNVDANSQRGKITVFA
ncbi:unnamed protein product [Gongylonema pulchrum]|uniref:Uncharacterized protein n=1 Tax=Gongylonema pulchrum TaxID=637853 RepID=A0A3P6RJQ6_9BILA|nr:unnamed protein product [Gongylonema pulchrum]